LLSGVLTVFAAVAGVPAWSTVLVVVRRSLSVAGLNDTKCYVESAVDVHVEDFISTATAMN